MLSFGDWSTEKSEDVNGHPTRFRARCHVGKTSQATANRGQTDRIAAPV